MIYEFKFPDVGEGVHEGKILQLLFKPGDKIEAGDILAEVETDKVVAEIPSPKDGILKKYGAKEEDTIEVGSVLAYIEISDEEAEKKTQPIEETGSVVGELQGPGDTVLPVSTEGLSDEEGMNQPAKILATPVARKFAADHGIDLSKVKGTGPGGRILKSDLIHFGEDHQFSTSQVTALPKAADKGISPLPAGKTQTIEFSQMRKTIAENMEKSQTIPAFIVQDYTVIDELAAYRTELKEQMDRRISFQPFFMKALAVAVQKYPTLNATFDENKKEVTVHSDVNIGMAVQTDEGLMVPVLKQVQNKSIRQINDEMLTLIDAAKNRTIQLDDLRGGTISITNYGSFGGVYGRAMILPPQVAILGFGRIHQTAVVKNGQVVPGTILPVSMSCDHRVVDGAPAASFLTYFLQLLGNIKHLLIEL